MNEGFDYKYWDEIKIKLFKMYPSLTRSDLLWWHGSKDDLLDMIANKLGKTTKELQNEIDSF
jgi:hypothetical protein